MSVEMVENPEESEATQTVIAVIECVSFYYEEGKGGENYRKKNKFRCEIPTNERSLAKLREIVW